MKARRTDLFLVSFLISSFALSASDYSKEFSFATIPPGESLPTSISSICTPDRDFVWAGSASGLVRLNNFASRLYEYDADDDNTIPSNNILGVVKDREENVWALTDGGLALYDRRHDKFQRKNIRAFSALVTDKYCYFGARDTIYRFDYAKGEIETAKLINGVSSFPVEAMFEWFDGTILISSGKEGQMFFDPQSGNLRHPRTNLPGLYSIWVDSSYHIWRPVFKGGVECYDSDFNLIAKYTPDNSGLSSDMVTSFCEYGGNIWMGTEGGGISVFDTTKKIFHHVENPQAPFNSIRSLSVCGNNEIWAGGRVGGIVVIRESGIQCKDIFGQSESSVSVGEVSDFFESDADGSLYLCSYGSGLFRMDGDDLSFTQIKSTSKMRVTSACDLPGGKILLSSHGVGLFTADRNTGSLDYFKAGDAVLYKTQEQRRSLVVNLTPCHDGTVLLTSRDRIFRYYPDTEEMRAVSVPEGHLDNFPILPASGGPRGKYFFNGTYVFSVEPNTNIARVAFTAPLGVTIKGVTVDSRDMMWFATNRGLSSLNIWTGEYSEIKSDVLKSAIGVICDNLGQIWVSTSSALYVYSSSSKTFSVIGKSDGLATDSFLAKPKILSRSGKLYFAGVRSIAKINPGIYVKPVESPSIVTESLLVDGKIRDISDVKLTKTGSALSIRLFVKSEDLLYKRAYRLKLEGEGREYIINEDLPVFDVYNLALGHYKVYAGCTTKNAAWTDWQPQFDLDVNLMNVHIVVIIIFVLFTLLFLFAYGYFSQRAKNTRNLERIKASNKAEEERLNFIVNVCHELRTPLTLIMSPLERMMNSMDKSDANYTPLKGIYKQSKIIKTLLNSAVTTVRASRELLTSSSLVPVAVNEWVKNVVDDFKSEATDCKLVIRTDFDPAVGVVNFDECKCRVVLSNIIMNALQHSPSGSDIIVSTENDSTRHFVRVSVSDAGEGIKDRDTNSLFKRYFMETEERSGYGVGLSYAKDIIEQSGGNLGAYNNKDGGSTFFFEIPSGVPVHSNAESGSENVENSAMQNKPSDVISPTIVEEDAPDAVEEVKDATVLIVEDNRELLNYLKYEFSFEMKSVLVAGNGVEAVKVLSENKVDVIVSDVMMPEMDGFALCRYVKTTLAVSHIPVILLTARSDESSRMLGYKNGADDYITKPFELVTLRDSIDRLLKYRAVKRENFRTSEGRSEVLESTFSSADENFLIRFDKLLRDNISNVDLNVSFVEDYFGIARPVLFQKVKQLTGMNIQGCITKIRMEKVITLMNTTNLSIAEIGEKAGFASPRYFSTSFKAYMGKTPSQYKRDIEQGKDGGAPGRE